MEKEEHKRMYPDYKFRPQPSKSKASKSEPKAKSTSKAKAKSKAHCISLPKPSRRKRNQPSNFGLTCAPQMSFVQYKPEALTVSFRGSASPVR